MAQMAHSHPDLPACPYVALCLVAGDGRQRSTQPASLPPCAWLCILCFWRPWLPLLRVIPCRSGCMRAPAQRHARALPGKSTSRAPQAIASLQLETTTNHMRQSIPSCSLIASLSSDQLWLFYIPSLGWMMSALAPTSYVVLGLLGSWLVFFFLVRPTLPRTSILLAPLLQSDFTICKQVTKVSTHQFLKPLFSSLDLTAIWRRPVLSRVRLSSEFVGTYCADCARWALADRQRLRHCL